MIWLFKWERSAANWNCIHSTTTEWWLVGPRELFFLSKDTWSPPLSNFKLLVVQRLLCVPRNVSVSVLEGYDVGRDFLNYTSKKSFASLSQRARRIAVAFILPLIRESKTSLAFLLTPCIVFGWQKATTTTFWFLAFVNSVCVVCEALLALPENRDCGKGFTRQLA